MSFFKKRIKKFWGENNIKPPNLAPQFKIIIFVKFVKIEAYFIKRKTELFLPTGFMLTVMNY